MAVFDGSIVNIALPQIARALKVPAGAAICVSNGFYEQEVVKAFWRTH
jgi:DHA2 family multidrug resistance protein-like MFS transporter